MSSSAKLRLCMNEKKQEANGTTHQCLDWQTQPRPGTAEVRSLPGGQGGQEVADQEKRQHQSRKTNWSCIMFLKEELGNAAVPELFPQAAHQWTCCQPKSWYKKGSSKSCQWHPAGWVRTRAFSARESSHISRNKPQTKPKGINVKWCTWGKPPQL